ncbi:hypothetical protein DRN86_02965 [Candidatus Geothermarchaeota archaeon]|nr:MAG: hypothetical protein DRN86_02965 [Candidatus Geothermarchaeota archaeon]
MRFLWDIPGDTEYFTAEDYVRYMCDRMGVDKFDVSDSVLMTFSEDVMRNLIRNCNAKRARDWIYGEMLPLYNGRYKGRKVSIIGSFIGAPGTIMILEELIACGMNKLIFIGVAAGLRREARVGTIILPTEAIREEGTSYHYLREDITPVVNKEVLEALNRACKRFGAKYIKGKVWTTDAIYREMISKIRTYSKNMVYAVDMESSAILSLAMFRKIKAGIILIISDELFHKRWRPLWGDLGKSFNMASKIALEAIQSLK